MNPLRYCYALDLKDKPEIIEAYIQYHKKENVWPEITDSIRNAGILNMDIFLTGNRLFMIMEVDESYDSIKKAESDTRNPKVQEWEDLMWTFQQQLPWAEQGEKWVLMQQIFKLN